MLKAVVHDNHLRAQVARHRFHSCKCSSTISVHIDHDIRIFPEYLIRLIADSVRGILGGGYYRLLSFTSIASGEDCHPVFLSEQFYQELDVGRLPCPSCAQISDADRRDRRTDRTQHFRVKSKVPQPGAYSVKECRHSKEDVLLLFVVHGVFLVLFTV